MPRIVLCFVFVLALFSLIHSSPANAEQKSCTDALLNAVRVLVEKEFGEHARQVVPAFNDVRCEPEAVMANMVVIVVVPKTKDALYDIFHIHASHKGELVSSSSFEEGWSSLTNPDDWKVPWCIMVHRVYPEEPTPRECRGF